MNTTPTKADRISPQYTPTSIVAKDGTILRVVASGYTKGQRKTWLRLEPTSSPAFVIIVANDATMLVVS